MVRMHNPPHPGEVLAHTVLRKDGGISITEFAKADKWLDTVGVQTARAGQVDELEGTASKQVNDLGH
jgi:plasmid maintenance system antidote protein VapI